MKCTIGQSRFRLAAAAITLLLQVSAAAADTVSVSLMPGDDIQSIVDAHSPGTLYIFQPGIYRMQAIVPKSGDVFDGRGAAVLNGSRLLTSFERVGALWAENDLCVARPGEVSQAVLDTVPLRRRSAVWDVQHGELDIATRTERRQRVSLLGLAPGITAR